jgi:5-formyltetrahydrofolate cyclo-ligase
MKTKTELRQAYRQLRKQLSGDELNDLSQKIAKQVGNWLEGQESLMQFHLFFPIAKFNEVNTFYLQQLLEQREQRIRLAAYFRAEQRGFDQGHALDDWLAAEQEEDEKSRPLTAD